MAYLPFNIVQSKFSTGSAANTSLTFDAAPTPGNLIITAMAIHEVSSSIVVPGGFTIPSNGVRPFSTNTWVVKSVYKLFAAGDSSTITWGNTAQTWEMLILEIDGNGDTNALLDVQSAMAVGLTVHTLQPGSATPTLNGAFCFAFCGVAGANGGTETIDSSFTLLGASTFSNALFGYKIKSETDKTAENPAFGWTTNQNCGAGMLVFSAAQGRKKEYNGSSFLQKPVKNSAGTQKPQKWFDGTNWRRTP